MLKRRLQLSRREKIPEVFPFALPHDSEFDGIVFNADYLLRVARSGWLKSHYGMTRIPRSLFKMVVNADITVEVLDRWFRQGGMPHVRKILTHVFEFKEEDDEYDS
jgi:hypothetical protein